MIRLNDIVVKFGDFTALHSINVHVKEGEFFTFLGPSGCGTASAFPKCSIRHLVLSALLA